MERYQLLELTMLFIILSILGLLIRSQYENLYLALPFQLQIALTLEMIVMLAFGLILHELYTNPIYKKKKVKT